MSELEEFARRGIAAQRAVDAVTAAFSVPRDPERIDRLVEKLRAAWHANPDWRLGQLIHNAGGHGDVFYREDDETERGLDHLIEQIGQARGTPPPTA